LDLQLIQFSFDQVFDVLVTRFKKAPSLIVYDDACRLQEYVLNREPEFFANTKFLVDSFHYKSHVNCNPSYNSGEYVLLMKKEIAHFAEIQNQKLTKMKKTVLFMLLRHFSLILIYFVARLNFAVGNKIPLTSVVGDGNLRDDREDGNGGTGLNEADPGFEDGMLLAADPDEMGPDNLDGGDAPTDYIDETVFVPEDV
jgi:hypothetical protein